MTEQNGRAEILRAAGYDDAADLLERLDKIDAANRAADEVDQPRQAPEPQRQYDPEAKRQAEGETLMAALRRDIPGLFEDR